MATHVQASTTLPVSIKGVVIRDGMVVLRKNERMEWELPGGRIELDETPQQCVARRIAAETRLRVTVGPTIDAWMYHVLPGRHVFVVTFGCHSNGHIDATCNDEQNDIDVFSESRIIDLPMPEGHKRAIRIWFDQQQSDRSTCPAEQP